MIQHYWETISNTKIAILGIVPPPYGGVSVHITRVMDQFIKQNNKIYFWLTEWPYRKFIFPLYIIRLLVWLICKKPKIVYYHSSYLIYGSIELLCLIFLQVFLQYKIFIVDHDCRHLSFRSDFSLQVFRWIIARIAGVICIGESTYQSYMRHKFLAESFVVSDAFIPPVERNVTLIWQTYPLSLHMFIKERTPILLLSAAHLMRVGDKDVYGIDFSLDIIAGIKDEYPDVGLIIGLPKIADQIYFDLLLQYMNDLSISEHIYIVHDNKELWPFFGIVDLFLRPTITDGDSISIREAIYFKVPVVASDVCSRPEGVILFSTGDIKNAIFMTKKSLKEYVYEPYSKRDYLYQKSYKRYMSLY